MNIILTRLKRALTLSYATSLAHQKQGRKADSGRRRRGSNVKGVIRFESCVNVRMTPDQKARLDALCDIAGIERGIVMRDAIDFYLGMAEQEMGKLAVVDTPVRPVTRRPAPPLRRDAS